MSFVLIAAGILLLSISFFIFSYSLIWSYMSILSTRSTVDNVSQNVKSINQDEYDFEDMYSDTPAIRRFDKRMDDLKRELAEINMPGFEDDYVPESPTFGRTYNLDHTVIDDFIKRQFDEKEEVSE